MHREAGEPGVEILLPDGRTVLFERRKGDPLRPYRPPATAPQERRRRPRREGREVRGQHLDLFA
ncbi:hypothetical protein HRbin40_00022 [bacterium HR40]|nr:hypothetical protein HRbin40_00022 [bacterium HR40]